MRCLDLKKFTPAAHPVGALLVFCLVGIFVSSCVTIARTIEVASLDVEALPIVVGTSTKAHLMNGNVALLPDGFVMIGDSLVASGPSRLYNTKLEEIPFDQVLFIDDVLALETFSQGQNEGGTIIMTGLATAGGALLTAVALVAIFGSCPTVYTIGPDGDVLQAELFSSSIAALFELKDFDRIDISLNERGVIELELRNEALETHYINQIELLEVPHGESESAYSIGSGKAMIVSGELAPSRSVDASGFEYSTTLAAKDDLHFETSSTRLDELSEGDLTDHLDLAWPAPASETAALVLRVRNSLLNTIFLYDVMIASQGARSLDWMQSDLNSIDMALELSDFFQRHMGIRIFVMGPDGYERIGQFWDVGPIAWESLVKEIPVLQQDSVRVRLEFLADGWRIDRAALGEIVSRSIPHRLPVSQIQDLQAGVDETARTQIANSDDSYLITGPGRRFGLRFESDLPPDTPRTYLMAAQGYYTEWVRGSWLKNNPVPKPLALNEETLLDVIRRWRDKKVDFEQQFYETQIRVR